MLGELVRKGSKLWNLQQKWKRSKRIPLPKMLFYFEQEFWRWFLQGPTALSKTTKKA